MKQLFLILLAVVGLGMATADTTDCWGSGTFRMGGCAFVPEDVTRSEPLDPQAFRDRIFSSKGYIRPCRRAVPSKVGSTHGFTISILGSMHEGCLFDSYYLTLVVEGGVDNTLRLCSRERACVTSDGTIHPLHRKDAVPADWVCLVAIKRQRIFLAWNPAMGGSNPAFVAPPDAGADAAVYKRLIQIPCGNAGGILSDCSGYTQVSDREGTQKSGKSRQ